MLGVVYLIRLFCLFPSFWSDLRVTVWRPFQAPFSSNFICLERFRCLVSNWPCKIWNYGHQDIAFERNVMRCWKLCDIFFLKILYLPNRGRYHRVLFMRGSQDIVLQVGSAKKLQFVLNRYHLLCKVCPKNYLFFLKKKNEVFIMVFGIFLVSHPF